MLRHPTESTYWGCVEDLKTLTVQSGRLKGECWGVGQEDITLSDLNTPGHTAVNTSSSLRTFTNTGAEEQRHTNVN